MRKQIGSVPRLLRLLLVLAARSFHARRDLLVENENQVQFPPRLVLARHGMIRYVS